jgi:hypothetical protein
MRKIKALIIALIATATMNSECKAADETPNISRQQADGLLSSGKFKHVRSKSEIPKVWWQAMSLEHMSDIGGPFSAGCTGTEPHRRLITGAVNEPYAIILSEQGGIAYMCELRIYKHDKDAIKSIYFENVFNPRIAEIQKKLGVEESKAVKGN